MADYSQLSDSQLADAMASARDAVPQYGDRARVALAEITAEARLRQTRRAQEAHTAARQAQASRVAGYADEYRQLVPRLEEQVQQWSPPPHPDQEAALAAEDAPQSAGGLGAWKLWNRPLVKTGPMWSRDQRAAELARRLQAERVAAEKAGAERLAAFDSVYPGIQQVNTDVSHTWSPGLEPWSGVATVLSYPGAWAGMFGSLAQAAAGDAMSAAGAPSYASDRRGELVERAGRAADSVLMNIPTNLAYAATWDRDYAPGYARAYWDDIKRRSEAPLSQLRPGGELPAARYRAADVPEDVLDFTGQMLDKSGMSDGVKLAVQLPVMFATGLVTDPFMPNYRAAKSGLHALGMVGKDAAYAGGMMAGIPVAQSMLTSRSAADQQAMDRYYDALIQGLRSQNRIAE